MNKTNRLLAIRELISKNKISNQDELLNLLKIKGFDYTQATLSRDLKFLKVNRISDRDRGYIFQLPEEKHIVKNEVAESYIAQGFISIEFANKLGVIKTLPGYANSIAVFIDKSNCFEILGTIAGDDTILVIPRQDITEKDVKNAIVLLIPELKNKIFN